MIISQKLSTSAGWSHKKAEGDIHSGLSSGLAHDNVKIIEYDRQTTSLGQCLISTTGHPLSNWHL